MIIGKLLDRRYRVFQVLSSGAFGRTYLAVDTRRPGSPQCVVKLLQPPNDNPQLLKTAHRLFKREAETLEKLGRHDQIPQLLAYLQQDQQFYLVEEFIPGNPLAKEIVPGKPLPGDKVVALLQEILEILVFVHGQGVIHRDVNPSNIIRRQADNKLVLIDFGSVKEVSTQILNTQQQTPWTVAAGTPAYMPIEQFQGNPQFNSDIYAVGMIAIQALTGLPGGDLPKLQNRRRQNPEDGDIHQIVWRHRAQVSPELANIIDKMVQSFFGQRYQSAAEALADLSNSEKTLDSSIKVPSRLKLIWQNQQQKSPARKMLLRSLAGAVVLVIISVAFAWYSQLPQKLMAQRLVKQGVDKSQQGDHKGAIADYDRAIQLQPNDSNAFYNRGLARYRLGQPQPAIEDFTAAIALNPQQVQAYTERGKTRFDLGDNQGALADYNQAIQLDPHLTIAYNGRGNVRAALGDEQAAIADYNQTIQLDPQLPAAYLNRCLSLSNLGEQQSNLGEQQRAIDDCTKAIQLKPNYAFAYQNRGLARLRLKDIQGAMADFNIAIGINPKDADPYYNRGLARYDLGEKQGALSDYSQAVQLNPNHALVYYDRGVVRSEMADRKGAIEDFQRSAKLCLDQGKLSCYKDAQYQLQRLQAK